MRTYTELSRLRTFSERYEYLKLDGVLGRETFGLDRYLNQRFYHSIEWRRIRDIVIARDFGCDLGVEGYDIHGSVVIHHMNPIVQDDIYRVSGTLVDPEFLICTTHTTHNAIHFGDINLYAAKPIERTPHDTSPWRQATDIFV